MLAPTSPEKREFVVDSGASMHMLSRKDSRSDKMETLRRSRNATTVQTNEEAQVYVHHLDLFVTVQILGRTLAVLSLGKLFEEHGHTHEWASGQKPHLTKQGKTIRCRTDNFVPLAVLDCRPILVPVRLLHSHRTTHQVHLQVQQQSEVTIWHQATGAIHQTQNKNEKRDNNQASGDRLRDFSEWLEVTENLEGAEVPAPAHIPHDSDSERRTKVALRKVILVTSGKIEVAAVRRVDLFRARARLGSSRIDCQVIRCFPKDEFFFSCEGVKFPPRPDCNSDVNIARGGETRIKLEERFVHIANEVCWPRWT